VAIERYRDARARIRGIAVSVDVDRSIDRKTPSRRDGGARDESLVAFLSHFSFSHFSMTTKRIARVTGTSSSSRWTPVRFIFFDVARTTRVKARRDARHARHSVLMSRGGVIGCAVLSCVRFKTKVSDARACVEKRSHLVVVAPFVIVRVTNRASSEESDSTSSVLLSNQKQTRAFVRVIRTRTLGSTPRAYPRARAMRA
jgi:hypothetical protein